MIVVQNRLSRALKLAGKLIHRWDKVEFEQTDPALAAAEERGEVWCTPSQLPKKECSYCHAPIKEGEVCADCMPKMTLLPQQQVVLQTKTSSPQKTGAQNGQRREARGSVLGHRR